MNKVILKEKIILNEKKTYKDSAINIGYGIDDKYVRPMATSIASFCCNNDDREIIVNIVSAYLSDSNIKKLNELALKLDISIIYYRISDDFLRTFPVRKSWSYAMYYRYLLPNLVEKAEYIYYFDADVICVRKCDELFNIKINNNVLGAAKDVKKTRIKRKKCLNLDGEYFNSGVLVINKKRWIKENVLNKLIDVIKNNFKILKYPDQDALNIVINGDYYMINNIFNTLEITNNSLETSKLLHFANHPKPWSNKWFLNPIYNTKAKNIYDDYEKITPWMMEDKENDNQYRELVKWIIKYFLS